MVKRGLSRREVLGGAAALGAGLAAWPLGAAAAEKNDPPAREPFGYCLNTATIQGQKLPIADEIDLTAKAGYQGFEPWVRELEQYVKDGGSLKDLDKRLRDAGLTVPSAIGFPEWIVDDETRRKKGLEDARRAMDLVQQIGGKRLAAPPVGATDQADLNLLKAADRYHALLEIGDRLGVTPMVEHWGFSKSVSRLGEAMLVVMESGHPQACVLADVYHLYKGGSGFKTLSLAGAAALRHFHINDYPALPRGDITDAHRVYPGDGVAPLKDVLRDLYALGFRGMLSLELFNRDYWKQDAVLVARTGLEKMRAVVRASFVPAP
jgi:sugar phosphate isomerase/epimerase